MSILGTTIIIAEEAVRVAEQFFNIERETALAEERKQQLEQRQKDPHRMPILTDLYLIFSIVTI